MARKSAADEVRQYLRENRFYEYEVLINGYGPQRILVLANGLEQANAAVAREFKMAQEYKLITQHSHIIYKS